MKEGDTFIYNGCPVCSGRDVKYYATNYYEDGTLRQIAECNNCGTEWYDVYKQTKYAILIKAKEVKS